VNAQRAYQKTIEIVWAAVLISLPFTSFPLFEKKFGVVVSPLSAGPLIIFILLWLFPFIFRGGQIPRECLPFLIFCLAAAAACGLAFFIDIPSLKGTTVLGQEVKALLTLALGAALYLVFSCFPKDQKSSEFTLKWINIGGAILILWTLTQVYFMFFNSAKFPAWYVQFQSIFSSKTVGLKYIVPRVTGLAYEPSWFSHQLMILYFPVWFAATIHRISAFKLRIFHLSIENVLLAIGFFEFFLSSPRLSLVALFIVGIYFFGKINLFLIHRIMVWLEANWRFTKLHTRLARRTLTAAIGIVMLAIYLSGTFLGVYAIGKRDARIGLLFKNPLTGDQIKGLLTFNEAEYIYLGFQLAFGERVVYWVTGFNIFNAYPWFGVGLGNSGFYFLKKMPVVGFDSPEIRTLLNVSASLPNIKSLWFRLLSETGLVGFSIFLAWLVLLWRSASESIRSKNILIKTIALAGQFSLLAFIVEGFSIDSFALPYLWVMSGLICAAGLLYRKENPG
jgi:hypothetical protein